MILSGSADALLTNILSFSSNVAALSSSYFVMDDDTTNYFEKEHFEFLLRDTFFTNCTSLKVLFLDSGLNELYCVKPARD